MDISILKDPLIIVVLAASVIITNAATYTVVQSDCGLEVAEALERMEAQIEGDQNDLKRALQPNEGLNPNRQGGLDLNQSIR